MGLSLRLIISYMLSNRSDIDSFFSYEYLGQIYIIVNIGINMAQNSKKQESIADNAIPNDVILRVMLRIFIIVQIITSR